MLDSDSYFRGYSRAIDILVKIAQAKTNQVPSLKDFMGRDTHIGRTSFKDTFGKGERLNPNAVYTDFQGASQKDKDEAYYLTQKEDNLRRQAQDKRNAFGWNPATWWGGATAWVDDMRADSVARQRRTQMTNEREQRAKAMAGQRQMNAQEAFEHQRTGGKLVQTSSDQEWNDRAEYISKQLAEKQESDLASARANNGMGTSFAGLSGQALTDRMKQQEQWTNYQQQNSGLGYGMGVEGALVNDPRQAYQVNLARYEFRNAHGRMPNQDELYNYFMQRR